MDPRHLHMQNSQHVGTGVGDTIVKKDSTLNLNSSSVSGANTDRSRVGTPISASTSSVAAHSTMTTNSVQTQSRSIFQTIANANHNPTTIVMQPQPQPQHQPPPPHHHPHRALYSPLPYAYNPSPSPPPGPSPSSSPPPLLASPSSSSSSASSSTTLRSRSSSVSQTGSGSQVWIHQQSRMMPAPSPHASVLHTTLMSDEDTEISSYHQPPSSSNNDSNIIRHSHKKLKSFHSSPVDMTPISPSPVMLHLQPHLHHHHQAGDEIPPTPTSTHSQTRTLDEDTQMKELAQFTSALSSPLTSTRIVNLSIDLPVNTQSFANAPPSGAAAASGASSHHQNHPHHPSSHHHHHAPHHLTSQTPDGRSSSACGFRWNPQIKVHTGSHGAHSKTNNNIPTGPLTSRARPASTMFGERHDSPTKKRSNDSDDETQNQREGDDDTDGDSTSRDLYKPLLPTVPQTGGQQISSETMMELLHGTTYSHLYDRVIIVDARFPYEYAGGHIRGAINLYKEAQVYEYFLRSPPQTMAAGQRICIIFHCEFSQERGPHLYKRLRGRDRDIHGLKNEWNILFYPEQYILHGGYKEFHSLYGMQVMSSCHTPTSMSGRNTPSTFTFPGGHSHQTAAALTGGQPTSASEAAGLMPANTTSASAAAAANTSSSHSLNVRSFSSPGVVVRGLRFQSIAHGPGLPSSSPTGIQGNANQQISWPTINNVAANTAQQQQQQQHGNHSSSTLVHGAASPSGMFSMDGLNLEMNQTVSARTSTTSISSSSTVQSSMMSDRTSMDSSYTAHSGVMSRSASIETSTPVGSIMHMPPALTSSASFTAISTTRSSVTSRGGGADTPLMMQDMSDMSDPALSASSSILHSSSNSSSSSLSALPICGGYIPMRDKRFRAECTAFMRDHDSEKRMTRSQSTGAMSMTMSIGSGGGGSGVPIPIPTPSPGLEHSALSHSTISLGSTAASSAVQTATNSAVPSQSPSPASFVRALTPRLDAAAAMAMANQQQQMVQQWQQQQQQQSQQQQQHPIDSHLSDLRASRRRSFTSYRSANTPSSAALTPATATEGEGDFCSPISLARSPFFRRSMSCVDSPLSLPPSSINAMRRGSIQSAGMTSPLPSPAFTTPFNGSMSSRAVMTPSPSPLLNNFSLGSPSSSASSTSTSVSSSTHVPLYSNVSSLNTSLVSASTSPPTASLGASASSIDSLSAALAAAAQARVASPANVPSPPKLAYSRSDTLKRHGLATFGVNLAFAATHNNAHSVLIHAATDNTNNNSAHPTSSSLTGISLLPASSVSGLPIPMQSAFNSRRTSTITQLEPMINDIGDTDEEEEE